MVLLCNMSILVLALLSVSSQRSYANPAKGNEDRADREGVCYFSDSQYSPIDDIPGHSWTAEESASACQNRCLGISGCSYFSFWEKFENFHGCHLSSSGATLQHKSGGTAGPSSCSGPCAELWEHEDYSGDSFKLYYDSPVLDLAKIGWNDKITSIRVTEDFAVEGYEHINLEGIKLEITEDEKSLLSKNNGGQNNWISSISCQKKCAVLWEHENYKGDFFNLYFNNPVSDLVKTEWNDKITSIRVSENFAVEAYEHIDEDGKKLEITEDKSLLSENDWISSISCQKKRLNKGKSLTGGEFLISRSGEYKFYVQRDGNLVIYQNGSVIWASTTQGSLGSVSKLILQDDGNLVLYSTNGKVIWASNTVDASAAFLEMQDDGNLVLYSTTGSALWASGTDTNIIVVQ